MVKHGHFSLGLIRAETGASYQEHLTPSGTEIYAEVEPEDEFYLQLRSDAPETVYVDLAVDGMKIQRGHRLHPRTTSKVGVLRSDDAGGRTGIEVALRFAKAKVKDGLASGATACAYWTGQVEATFYGDPNYRIPVGAFARPDTLAPVNQFALAAAPNAATFPQLSALPSIPTRTPSAPYPPPLPAAAPQITPTFPAPIIPNRVKYIAPTNTYFTNDKLANSDVGYVPGKTDDKHKKGVKSAEGKTALRTLTFSNVNSRPVKKPKSSKHCPSYGTYEPQVKEPEKLGTITLKYCSALGLIHAKILTKPPDWDLDQAKKKCTKELKEEHEQILSKVKVLRECFETINSQDGRVVRKEEREILDLTGWDD